MNRSVIFVVVVIAIIGIYWIQSRPNPTREIKTDNKEISENPNQLSEPVLSVRPETIVQGEAVLISIKGLGDEKLKSLTFNGKKLSTFMHLGDPSAMVGVDLRMDTGTYPLVATLSNGDVLKEDIEVKPRNIERAPLGIPDKLGGNTEESQKELINTLVEEAAIMNAIPSADTKLWDGPFRMPINPPITITDTYGYSRITGGNSISHKGTDFRAAIGTPVYAMNSGVVRFTDYLRNYGYTVVIDHGLGLHTVYMHLSEILVKEGQSVNKGDLIAKSGNTGYVIGPHLHLSVRINAISIDPMRFMDIFGE